MPAKINANVATVKAKAFRWRLASSGAFFATIPPMVATIAATTINVGCSAMKNRSGAFFIVPGISPIAAWMSGLTTKRVSPVMTWDAGRP